MLANARPGPRCSSLRGRDQGSPDVRQAAAHVSVPAVSQSSQCRHPGVFSASATDSISFRFARIASSRTDPGCFFEIKWRRDRFSSDNSFTIASGEVVVPIQAQNHASARRTHSGTGCRTFCGAVSFSASIDFAPPISSSKHMGRCSRTLRRGISPWRTPALLAGNGARDCARLCVLGLRYSGFRSFRITSRCRRRARPGDPER